MAHRTSSFVQMFGRRRTAKASKPRRSFVPSSLGMVTLEERLVQSTAVLSQGILTVTGTSGNDVIKVVESGKAITADGKSFALGSVNSIVVKGLDGRDSITVSSKKPSTLDGGTGDDNLTATSGNDRLIGGEGTNRYPGVAASNLIIDPKLTGGRAMNKAILDKYQSLGGPTSFLWAPKADQVMTGTVASVEFLGGSIYWNQATGARVLNGDILAKYKALGGPSSFLVVPTADQTLGSGAYVCEFQGGNIYWSVATGSHVLNGDILAKYKALGGPSSFLGAPRTDQAMNGGIYWCDFSGGSIYWGPTTGAHVLNGDILARYRALGGHTGTLGVPTTDQTSANGIYWCDFQKGSLIWTPQYGAKAVYGSVRDKYYNLSGIYGFLGVPTGDQQTAGGATWCNFQGGTVIGSANGGPAYEVHGPIRETYNSLGGAQGLLGLPVSDQINMADGTRVSRFQGGQITWRANTGPRLAFTRNEVIAALKRSQLDGTLNAGEFAFFRNIARDLNITTDAITRNLMSKLIDGDRANASSRVGVNPMDNSTPGYNVGNLYAGAPAWMVDVLEKKWFQGQDRPYTGDLDGKTMYAYQKVEGDLFGPFGPSLADVQQGRDGDCYFLASLGAVALKHPDLIRNMFTDNGDGTFTVRFFHDGGPADYVTVDRHVPVNASGNLVYAGNGRPARLPAGTSASNAPVWVILAEKAYAQLNQSGWIGQDGTNSYNGTPGNEDGGLNGGNGADALAHITGWVTRTDKPGLFSRNFADTALDAVRSGRTVVVNTKPSVNMGQLVGGHSYVLVAADSGGFTVMNPWGYRGSAQQGVAYYIYLSRTQFLENFGSINSI